MHRNPLLTAAALAAAAVLTACSSTSDLVASEARADPGADVAAGAQVQCATPRHCTPALTAGTYVVACRGQVAPGANAPFVPMNILGTVKADAKGVFSGTTEVMLAGQHIVQQVSGTEALNADCTGTITYATRNQTGPGTWEDGAPIDISFVVSAWGERIDGLVTDPGAALACELLRQRAP